MQFNPRKFADIRKKNKVTQVDAARKIGCTQAAVQAWETGKYKPNRLNMKVLADAIGCEVADLIDDYTPLPPVSKYAALIDHPLLPMLLDSWMELDIVECAQVIKYTQNLAKAKKKHRARKTPHK